MFDFKHILVPLDGSPDAEKALPTAIALAKKLGSAITLLHVMDLPVPTFPKSDPEIVLHKLEELREQLLDEARRYLVAHQTELHDHRIDAQIIVRDGAPAKEIIDGAAAEKVDLIVMCAQGRGALILHTLGGIADKVLRQSPCPVLFARQVE